MRLKCHAAEAATRAYHYIQMRYIQRVLCDGRWMRQLRFVQLHYKISCMRIANFTQTQLHKCLYVCALTCKFMHTNTRTLPPIFMALTFR